MPKPRTKRALVREERKRKCHEQNEASRPEPKRSRTSRQDEEPVHHGDAGEKEFFGMLADEEQEYFRRADEMLELNDFPSPEDRDVFVHSVYREAQSKELKLASSQSCSRLMERLIQLSNTAQKKRLFEAFAGHFPSLVQHRFASHCCEALFLRSAGVVTQELAGFDGFVVDTKGKDVQEQAPEASMESLFLATLDELEGSLSFLMTDRFASHALRVLLLVLSGRPLQDASTKTLIKSRKKEHISVAGSAAADVQNQGLRAVPDSFTLAMAKIISDTTAELDATGLRVLAKHPIGNPTLQLLLELDMTLNKSDQKPDPDRPSLLQQLLPGAPQSLADGSSEASEFINGMMYDQIGSRLIEILATHCPGKMFKALNHNIFLPRIQGYVRNDISSYPAIKVLNRLSKDDLVEAVDKIVPTVPQLVSKTRFNVLKTLFERCAVRGASDEIKQLMRGLREGCGNQAADLVMTLCCLGDDKEKVKDVDQLARNQYAIQSHGAQLLTTLLSIPGPSKGVHEAILALPIDLVVRLATTSMPTVTLLTSALHTPSANSTFQKGVVSGLSAHVPELAVSQFGHNLINAIAEVPSKGKDLSVPCHMKEAVMQQLWPHEMELRNSWMGRSVWRTWKGDMWKTRRGDWKVWMNAAQEETQPGGARKERNAGDRPAVKETVKREKRKTEGEGNANEARPRSRGAQAEEIDKKKDKKKKKMEQGEGAAKEEVKDEADGEREKKKSKKKKTEAEADIEYDKETEKKRKKKRPTEVGEDIEHDKETEKERKKKKKRPTEVEEDIEHDKETEKERKKKKKRPTEVEEDGETEQKKDGNGKRERKSKREKKAKE
ncbi:Armadillo-type fold protein [Ophiocordyceps sinensis CO18]|uniref:Nucleolar protein 9 n=1 Tax=Ophiocordyceps sinensis (strain Co18 / CGMCC 3.14243) TaxID=911162 RepID=T5AD03_OPHSC|nr:Armadillo-type fold protein [Ophiocordyceps sinensis CO18]